MAGTILKPPAAAVAAAGTLAGVGLGVGGSSSQLTPSAINSYRISIVVERLASHVQPGNRGDGVDFFNLCLSLSRGIDYAVANNEIPREAQELPMLFKQICQRKNDAWLKAAIMVLMMSVKNACQIGWFQQKDTEELLAIADEIGKNYSSMGNVHEGISYCASTISTIMERFFPQMKLGQVLASIQVKPGYGAYAVDVHISKNTVHSPQDKIWLLVAQIDNIETSACIISPQQVSFLLNGKGVERRTNVFMDPGPLMPTNVTGVLKYGTNLLQAVGQFNGNYVILVAFMSVKSPPENPVLEKYVQPPLMPVDSDSDIVEESSRISLNCPISFKRIKTPVKGRLCKHLQCFDFNNFIHINSRKPAWRCPHCNQPVCYPDIRIDQNMVEVLKDIGENVVEVIIRADGSWKAVLENDDVDKTQNKAYNSEKEQTEAQESTCSLRANYDVLDLTNDDDPMEIMNSFEMEDRKPLQADLQFHSVPSNPTSLGMNAAGTNENAAAPLEDDFWSGLYFSQGGLDAPAVGTASEHPVLTDTLSTAFNREADGIGNNLTPNSVMQNQFPAPNNLQLQQFDHLNSVVNEYGRSPTVTAQRHINRTPVAIQALPAQPQGLGPLQRSRINMNSPITSSTPISPHVSLSSPATVDGLSAILSDAQRQQLFSRPLINVPQVPGMTSSAQQHHSATQMRRPSSIDSSAPSHLLNPFQPSQFLTALQNPHLQQSLNPRTPRQVSPSPGTVRPINLQWPHTQQGGSRGGIAQAAGATANSQRGRVTPPIQIQNQTSRTATPYPADSFQGSAGEQRGNVGGTGQSIPRPDGSLNLQSEQNWRPTGRMRGSLSGRAYSDAVRQLIIEPSQSGQNVRPQSPRPTQSVPSLSGQNVRLQNPRPAQPVPSQSGQNMRPQNPPGQSVPSASPQAPPTNLPNNVLPQLQALIGNRNAGNHPEIHNPSV